MCHWLTVMAPGLTVDVDDLPPELRQREAPRSESVDAATPVGEVAADAVSAPAMAPVAADWELQLARVARELLRAGQPELMDQLTRSFERAVIQAALEHTHGRRIEAAVKLGIGRNTITRKIQELGLDD